MLAERPLAGGGLNASIGRGERQNYVYVKGSIGLSC